MKSVSLLIMPVDSLSHSSIIIYFSAALSPALASTSFNDFLSVLLLRTLGTNLSLLNSLLLNSLLSNPLLLNLLLSNPSLLNLNENLRFSSSLSKTGEFVDELFNEFFC